ncbi:MAG: hypothetical protein ACT6U0_16495 [Shinella sp.]|uniref:hypothetical protein n=1 Tax=Shinella sp. TaxID=1870904 RepID=UPI004035B8A9
MNDHDGPLDLPASMADIFLALVAVVILMLLSLLPALQKPGGLATQRPSALSWNEIVIDGEKPAVYVAVGAGIEVADTETRIGLDDVLQNQALLDGLRTAAQERSILLVVQPDGQESAFLFASLMGTLSAAEFYQLRVDSGCIYVLDPKRADLCRSSAGAEVR